MKEQFRFTCLLLMQMLGLLLTVTISAYDFKVNGICYVTTQWRADGASVTYESATAPSYSNLSGFVNIPSSVDYNGDGWMVRHINAYSFNGCRNINQLAIAGTVEDIGNHAFYNCSGMVQAAIGNAVTKIGDYAFYGCSSLNNLTIGASVKEIGTQSFGGCTFLYDVSIPDKVESIGSGAFRNCNNLMSITMGKSVGSIGRDAFELCNNLREVRISDLESWCSIRFTPSEAGRTSFSNPLYFAHHLYLNGKEIKDLVIPKTVSGINNLAFFGCSGLTSVVIPNSAHYINEQAFDGCSGLSSVSIGNGVTYIEKNAFARCYGLKTIYAYPDPNSIAMGDYVFTGVTPGNVTVHVRRIHYDAYRNAPQWKDFNIVGDLGDKDVNHDSDVNVGDVNAVLAEILAGGSRPTCDVNLDGEVNVGDVNAILADILGSTSGGGNPGGDNPADVREYTVNNVTFKVVKVKGGTFTMGATDEQGSDGESDEKPVHKVTLNDYYIGLTEVTEQLWKAVMGSNPSYYKKGDNYPVENISWNDCQTFVSKLNALTGETFRLPTEAEWEFAARGGVLGHGCKFSGSNIVGDVAWYNSNSGVAKHPVATKQPNELGLYDMSGNVDEWCQDWYGSYNANAQTNPSGPSSGTYRVSRGGSWDDSAKKNRVSSRHGGYVSDKSNILGLRLVR